MYFELKKRSATEVEENKVEIQRLQGLLSIEKQRGVSFVDHISANMKTIDVLKAKVLAITKPPVITKDVEIQTETTVAETNPANPTEEKEKKKRNKRSHIPEVNDKRPDEDQKLPPEVNKTDSEYFNFLVTNYNTIVVIVLSTVTVVLKCILF